MYSTVISNSCKTMMNFSDFPFPKDVPLFLPHQLFYKYLEDYAHHFDLKKYIQFNTEVACISQATNYERTGRWKMVIQRTKIKTGKDSEIEYFEGVMVCTGFFTDTKIPHFPGLDNFKAEKIHSKQYRTPEMFINKRILIIGNSSSAGDIAVDACKQAKSVYLSVGNGTVLIPRTIWHGSPLELLTIRRVNEYYFPSKVFNIFFKRMIDSYIDQANYGLMPEDVPWQSAYMINDELAFRIASGQVIIKPHVRRFTENQVIFEDATVLKDLDLLVFATGYNWNFRFLNSCIIGGEFELMKVYKMVWPMTLTHGTLAMIGFINTSGSQTPVLEIQARWAARVMSGRCELPPMDVMEKDIALNKDTMLKKWGKYMIKVNNLCYRDSIAEMIGCKPHFWKLFCRDPKLAILCFFGPAFPYQYRLMGPHRWCGARQACLYGYENTVIAARTRVVHKKKEHIMRSLFTVLSGVAILIMVYKLIIRIL